MPRRHHARQEKAAETHPAHERAEQDAERDDRRPDDELKELKPDDFVNQRGAAAADEQDDSKRGMGILRAGSSGPRRACCPARRLRPNPGAASPGRRTERMNVLVSSSGSVATFAQKFVPDADPGGDTARRWTDRRPTRSRPVPSDTCRPRESPSARRNCRRPAPACCGSRDPSGTGSFPRSPDSCAATPFRSAAVIRSA